MDTWKANIAALNAQYTRLFRFDEYLQCMTDSSGWYYMYNYRDTLSKSKLSLTWRLPNNNSDMYICWSV